MEHWQGLPQELVVSPSLKVFKSLLDVGLGSLLWGSLLGQGGHQVASRGPASATLWFCENWHKKTFSTTTRVMLSLEPAVRRELDVQRGTRSCFRVATVTESGCEDVQLALLEGTTARHSAFAPGKMVYVLKIMDSLWETEISLLEELSEQIKAMNLNHLNLLASCDDLRLFQTHHRGAHFCLRSWHNTSWLECHELSVASWASQEDAAFPTSLVHHLPTPTVRWGSTHRAGLVMPEKSLFTSLLTFREVTPLQGGSHEGSPQSHRRDFPSNKVLPQQRWAKL